MNRNPTAQRLISAHDWNLDVIFQASDKMVESIDDLESEVYLHPVGSKMRLSILRKGKPSVVSIEIQARQGH